jgi:hypothetical protein
MAVRSILINNISLRIVLSTLIAEYNKSYDDKSGREGVCHFTLRDFMHFQSCFLLIDSVTEMTLESVYVYFVTGEIYLRIKPLGHLH